MNDIVIITERVKNLKEPVPGAVIRRCDRCNKAVWVSPGSLKRVKQEESQGNFGWVVICRHCVRPDEAFNPSFKPRVADAQELFGELLRRFRSN